MLLSKNRCLPYCLDLCTLHIQHFSWLTTNCKWVGKEGRLFSLNTLWKEKVFAYSFMRWIVLCVWGDTFESPCVWAKWFCASLHVFASLVCWFFIHRVKKKCSHEITLLHSYVPKRRWEETKHYSSAVVHSSYTSQACHLHVQRFALCIFITFFPSQDIDRKHRRKTAHIPHLFSHFHYFLTLNAAHFPLRFLFELYRK